MQTQQLQKILLLLAAIGLIPIALSYGLVPKKALTMLYGFTVADDNLVHIFRAVMGLYLAQIAFWFLGAFKANFRKAAMYSLVVFMFGLAAGRVLSLVAEGMPHWLLVVYFFLEMTVGLLGLVLLKRAE